MREDPPTPSSGHSARTSDGGSTSTVVYSCVTGHYDLPPDPPPIPDGDIRLIYFTDRPPRTESGWEFRPLASPPRMRDGHDISRFHKAFPHRLFPEHRYSIYLDGNIRYPADVTALLRPLTRSGAGLGAFRHPDCRTLEEEAEFCGKIGKFDTHDLNRIEPQLRFYSEAGLDLEQPIPANYLLVRDHGHPALTLAMSVWWSHLFEFTKRDQVALLFALETSGLPWIFLDDHSQDLKSPLTRVPHKGTITVRARRTLHRVREFLSKATR